MTDNQLRVITYNILYGFDDRLDQCPVPGELRRADVTQWLCEQQPDIVALQELNGYTQQRLQSEAKAWGHGHAVLLAKSEFHIGVTSRSPIEVVEIHTQGMHHGLLHCKTANIHIFATHFSPHKYKHRQQEVAMVLERIKPVVEAGGEAILLGDLNSLSATDEQRLLNTDALEYWRKRNAELDFLENLNDNYFDFTVTDAILAVGLIDLYQSKHPDSDFWPRARVDYIFASSNLAQNCLRTQWIANDAMQNWSDHYPVIADFNRQSPQ